MSKFIVVGRCEHYTYRKPDAIQVEYNGSSQDVDRLGGFVKHCMSGAPIMDNRVFLLFRQDTRTLFAFVTTNHKDTKESVKSIYQHLAMKIRMELQHENRTE